MTNDIGFLREQIAELVAKKRQLTEQAKLEKLSKQVALLTQLKGLSLGVNENFHSYFPRYTGKGAKFIKHIEVNRFTDSSLSAEYEKQREALLNAVQSLMKIKIQALNSLLNSHDIETLIQTGAVSVDVLALEKRHLIS